MPNKDGTGPQGMGPMTGRGFGPCAGGMGFRRGFRRAGRGFGRGFGFNRAFAGSVEFTKTEQKKILEEELKELEEEKKEIEKELKEL